MVIATPHSLLRQKAEQRDEKEEGRVPGLEQVVMEHGID